MSNPLTKIIIDKILILIKDSQNKLGNDGFLFFNKPIDIKSPKPINRVGTFNAFLEDEILPMSFWQLSSKTLLKIHNILKNNQFHSYRMVDGKKYKIKLKKNETTRETK